MAGSIMAPDATDTACLPRFAGSRPGSIAIGQEWMVLDRATCDLRPAAHDVVRLLDRHDAAWTVGSEIDAAMLDVVTPALGGYRAAADELEDARRRVGGAAAAAGAAVAGGGAHPVRPWSGRRLRADARSPAPLVGFGMRVRVGVPDPDEAVRVCAWLGPRAPLFLALSASSPWWQGVDSGFCSARNNVIATFQASGIMPAALRDWEDVERHVARLARRGLADGIGDVDWDVRPDPAHGAVELRSLDTPLHPAYGVALACYARELCVEAAEHPGAWPARSAPELYQWNRFNAAKRGVLGDWIDPCTRRKHRIEHMVRNDLARLAARSNDPDFPAACVLLHELLHNGGQARWLTARVAAGSAPAELARLAGEIFARPVVPGWKVES